MKNSIADELDELFACIAHNYQGVGNPFGSDKERRQWYRAIAHDLGCSLHDQEAITEPEFEAFLFGFVAASGRMRACPDHYRKMIDAILQKTRERAKPKNLYRGWAYVVPAAFREK